MIDSLTHFNEGNSWHYRFAKIAVVSSRQQLSSLWPSRRGCESAYYHVGFAHRAGLVEDDGDDESELPARFCCAAFREPARIDF